MLNFETPYLAAIGALMYLANNTRPDIAFAVSLLARFSSEPTQRHWKGVKDILRYLRGSEDLGLYYENTRAAEGLVGYADAGFLSDPHKARSQTGYVFLQGGTAISWRSTKQSFVATSSNHAEILALHEASRECVWLRSLTNHIRQGCGYSSASKPTKLHEDNASCVKQVTKGFIKGDRTKHISPKLFYAHELHGIEIEVTKIQSFENVADLFTKSLGKYLHRKFTYALGMRRLSAIEGE